MHTDRDRMPYVCGDRIAGKYQLLRPIGAGGMGVVWVAHNLVLDVHVAVKLIRSSIAGPGAAARLLREARSAARLAHPGVVRVFDHGTTEGGDPFIVMELLEGETLRELLDREQRLSPLRAAAYLLPVADALAALGDAGIVHRDLKPENILLTPHGGDARLTPKLVDFGVAFVSGTDRLTHAGLMVGTPDYIAPEQADGIDVDARADVWAFSVVLFEAILGKRPFEGNTVTEVITSILGRPAPLLSAYGACDAELSAIVARGLEKSPQDRWPSMREMGAALAAWASARGLTEDVSGIVVRAVGQDPAAAHVAAGSPPPLTKDTAKTELALTRRKPLAEPPRGSARPTRLLPGLHDPPPDPRDAAPPPPSATGATSQVPAPIEAPAPSIGPRRSRLVAFIAAAGLLALGVVLVGLRRPAQLEAGVSASPSGGPPAPLPSSIGPAASPSCAPLEPSTAVPSSAPAPTDIPARAPMAASTPARTATSAPASVSATATASAAPSLPRPEKPASSSSETPSIGIKDPYLKPSAPSPRLDGPVDPYRRN